MNNLEIQFNRNIINKIKSLNFQVDQLGSVLFILFSLYENRLDLLDEFDDFNKQRRAIFLYKEMELKDLVVQVEEDSINGEQIPLFTLTPKGVELVEYLKGEFSATNQVVNGEIIAISGVHDLKESLSDDDPESWIDEWLNIFPRGIKSGGRLLRSDKPSCIRKMRVFLREYKYSKDTIINATKKYISSKEKEGYAYTQCAVYFIYRSDGARSSERISNLASWCDQSEHESNDEIHNSENNLEIMV